MSKNTTHASASRFSVMVFSLLLILSFNNAYALDASSSNTLTPENITRVLNEAHSKYKNNKDGKNADYIKALADVDPNLFGITIVTVDGNVYETGDTKSEFSIQSISKVFTAAKAMQQHGAKAVQEKIGASATGLAFNSIIAIEQQPSRAGNPFVNAGAIASTSLIKAENGDQRWDIIKSNMDAFAGRKLAFNETVYQSEVNDNKRNQAISKLLDAYGRMYADPLETTTIYTKQCSVNVSSHDLAVMGSTLANHGINPVTRKKVIDPEYPQYILALMATAGLYDGAGDWLYNTGTPAKSGVGGGILAVVPGKLAIGVFAPPLDKIGNSVKGQLAAAYIIRELGLNPYNQ